MPKKLKEVEVVDIQDATVPFKYIVTRDHVWGSKSKAGKLSTNAFSMCVQEIAINAMPGVLECKYHKTIAYVRLKSNPGIALRFTPSQDGKGVAEINDNKGKKELLKILKNPMELWLEVPRRNRSLEYLRSDEMKEIRARSREVSDGTRSYDAPTSKGFRSGSGAGKAHMWCHKKP